MCWLGDCEIGRSAKVDAEAERAERAAKMATLKSLRLTTRFLLPEADLQVSFPEDLDCSLLVAALTRPKASAAKVDVIF